jgi:hypothetical protein
MKNEHLDAALAELGKFDIESTLANGGRHQKLSWQIDGRPRRTIAISGSPSDARGLLNLRAQIRRTLRADGAAPPDNARHLAQQILLTPLEPMAQRVERLEREVAELQDIVVELLLKLEQPLSLKPDPEPAPAPKPKSPPMEELLRNMRYDEPLSAAQLAKATGRTASHVSSYLTRMKREGLVKQLSDRRGWLKAPIP